MNHMTMCMLLVAVIIPYVYTGHEIILSTVKDKGQNLQPSFCAIMYSKVQPKPI